MIKELTRPSLSCYASELNLVPQDVRTFVGGPSEEEAMAAEKIRVAKEALVSKENIADDTLGDEEWSVISASR